jgi:hypothetical protein
MLFSPGGGDAEIRGLTKKADWFYRFEQKKTR